MRGDLHGSLHGGEESAIGAEARCYACSQSDLGGHGQCETSIRRRIQIKRPEMACELATVSAGPASLVPKCAIEAVAVDSGTAHSSLFFLSWTVAGISQIDFSDFVDDICEECEWSAAALQELGKWASGTHFYFKKSVLIGGLKRQGSMPVGIAQQTRLVCKVSFNIVL